jgi:uncharacterized protein (TIGR02246 family)
MNAKLAVAAVVGLVVGLLVAASLSDTRRSADEAAIRALLEEQDAAWNRGDLDGFMKWYWDDEKLTYVSGDNVTKGHKGLRERYRQRYQAEGKEMGKLTFSDLEVKDFGDGWATARGRWKVVTTKEPFEGLFVLVLRRLPEGWRIVHDYTAQVEGKKG